jgi:hypothetical protein
MVDIGFEGRRECVHKGSTTGSLPSTPAKHDVDYPATAFVLGPEQLASVAISAPADVPQHLDPGRGV